MNPPTFRHSGKLGDIIYGLTVIRPFGKAVLYLDADKRHMDESGAAQIIPLLDAQPYIQSAQIWQGEPIDFELDGFRNKGPAINNLADCHLRALGLSTDLRNRQWLFVDGSPAHPVIFARSKNHHGTSGFWETAYQHFGDRAAFVGTTQEHADFIALVGPVPHEPTRDLLDVANVIAGAKLFVGNQSCPYAIAEALKRPVIQEVFTATPNCIFEREDAAFIFPGNDIEAIFSRMSRYVQ